MPSQRDSDFIDLTTPPSSAETLQHPPVSTPPRPTQLPSFMSSGVGSSSSKPVSGRGTKRKQAKITSFFPSKKIRIETVVLAADRKAARAQEKSKQRVARKNWREWHEEHQKSGTTFEILESDKEVDHLIATECKNEFGLDLNERKCLEYCERENPIRSDYSPMKLYRRREVAKLAWRKEAMLEGLLEKEIGKETLLKTGKGLFERRTGRAYDYKGRIA